MRVILKFIFGLLFLVFTTANFANTQDIFVPNDIAAWQTQSSHAAVFTVPETETFLALPENKSDNTPSTSTTGRIKQTNQQNFYVQIKKQQKINNTNIISSILKTEISPNAP